MAHSLSASDPRHCVIAHEMPEVPGGVKSIFKASTDFGDSVAAQTFARVRSKPLCNAIRN